MKILLAFCGGMVFGTLMFLLYLILSMNTKEVSEFNDEDN